MMVSNHISQSHGQRGIALVTVMWMVAFLSILAAGVTVVARSDIQLTRNVVGLAQARSEAEGGIYYAITRLTETGSAKWIGNGSIYRVPISQMKVEVRVQDEAGRIDLNVADSELLRNLFVAGGADVELADICADAVMDWRDADQLRRMHGAEWGDYVAAGLGYAPRNAPFPHIDELQLVLPISNDLFESVKPALTIYSNSKGINPALAPRMALMAISGSGPLAVADYFADREANPGQLVTQGMPQLNRKFIEAVGGRVFSISSQATSQSGFQASVSAVVSLQPNDALNPFVVLDWSQDPATTTSSQWAAL